MSSVAALKLGDGLGATVHICKHWESTWKLFLRCPCQDLLSGLKCASLDSIDVTSFLGQGGGSADASDPPEPAGCKKTDASQRVLVAQNAEQMRSLKFALIKIGVVVDAWVYDAKSGEKTRQVYKVIEVTDDNVTMRPWSDGELKGDDKVVSCKDALKSLKIAEKKQTKIECTWPPVHETSLWQFEGQKGRVVDAMGKLHVPFYANVAPHLQVYKNPIGIQVTKTFAKGELVIQSACHSPTHTTALHLPIYTRTHTPASQPMYTVFADSRSSDACLIFSYAALQRPASAGGRSQLRR